MEKVDLIIVGAGPAGLTAGIYAGRAKLDTVILEKHAIGGLAATTDRIENYPGFPEGISGVELAERLKKQVESLGVRVIPSTEVIEFDVEEEVKKFVTTDKTYLGKAAIIATGCEPIRLNVPGEATLRGRGVSYCAICDGPFFKGKDVVVVGAGSSGLQESLYLARFVNKVTIIEILPQPTGEKILQDRVKHVPNIELLTNHKVIAIEGDTKVEAVRVLNMVNNDEYIIKADAVFVYMGLKPITEFLRDKVKLDAEGYIVTDENLQTSIPGIFGAGDVRRKVLRQIATAVGDGALAAYMAQQYIEKIWNLSK